MTFESTRRSSVADVTASLLISELAARSGFPPSTLRYYEQVGLLAASERSTGGYRLYDEAAVSRLRFIERAKQLGLPLEEIRELVAVWDGGLCAHVQDRLRTHVAAKAVDVRARLGALRALADQLDAAGTALAEQAPDGPCGDGCGCVGVGQGSELVPVPVDLGLTQIERLASSARSPGTPGAATAAGMSAVAVPVACTLESDEQPGRLAAWTELLAAVEHRESIDGGLRLIFPADPELAGRLADLTAREQGCCAFFAFTLHLTQSGIQLEVTAPADAASVVVDLFGAPA